MTLMKRLFVFVLLLAFSVNALADIKEQKKAKDPRDRGDFVIHKDYERNLGNKGPLMTEDFNGAFPPDGWSLQAGSGDWEQLDISGDGSDLSAHYDCYNILGTTPAYLASSTYSIPAEGDYELIFWVNHYLVAGTWGDTDELYVDISTNGGSSWNQGAVNYLEGQAGAGWVQCKVPLSSYSGSEINFRFKGISCWGSYSILVDDVSIEKILDFDAPVITSLTGNIGHVGEDLHLSLKVYDESGIASIVATASIDGIVINMNPVTKTRKGRNGEKAEVIYEGVVPAQNDGLEVNGTITFELTDTANPANVGTEEYPLRWTFEPAVFLDFEDGVFPPAGWTLVDADGDSNNWYLASSSNNATHSGSYAMSSASYSGGILNPDNWIISPVLANPEKISYWVCAQDADWPAEKYGIYVSTTTTSPAAFTEIFSETMEAKVPGAWYEREISLAAYSGQETVYVAIRHYDSSDNFRINFDDISIWSADISAPVITEFSGNNGFVGEDLTISVKVSDQTNIASVVGKATIDGVQSRIDMSLVTKKSKKRNGEKIEKFYEGVVPAQNKEVVGSIFFELTDTAYPSHSTTTGDYELKWINAPVLAIFEGFEDGSVPPAGWTTLDADGDDLNWQIAQTPSMSVHSGEYSMASASWTSADGALTPDNWMISPKISKPEKISYWVCSQDADWAAEKYGIFVSTTTTDPADFTEVYSEVMTAKASGAWYEREIDLSAYSNEETVYVAIRHYGCTDQFMIVFDDISIWARDEDAPVISSISGCEVQVEHDMTLEIIIDDASNLDTSNPVTAVYSINGGAETTLRMTASDKGRYIYTGTIPAQNELATGSVKFTVKDELGYFNAEPYTYDIAWVNESLNFVDSFENGAAKWNLEGTWALTDEASHTTHNSLTESPGVDYAPNMNSSATIANAIDLSGEGVYGATLSFWVSHSIEEGADFDNLYVEASIDGGRTWEILKVLDGDNVVWHKEVIDVSGYVGSDEFKFRFRFFSNATCQLNGSYIDDVQLELSYEDNFAPQIVFDGPSAFEGYLYDNILAAELRDPSGISETSVVYSVDGAGIASVKGSLVGGNVYTYAIPDQPAGSRIEYRIVAKDNSEEVNVSESPVYELVTGTHLVYDNNFVTDFTAIGATQNTLAIAVKAEVPQAKGKAAELKGVAVRFYEDYRGHVSGDALIRIFREDKYGLPGAEITKQPVLFTPDHNGFHYIDMRDCNLKDLKNFFIALYASSTTVYAATERPSESGLSDYYSSYFLTSDGEHSAWYFANDTNFMIRPVIGEHYNLGIDGLMPERTTLSQNYPNPFNPTTSINYSVVNNGHVDLAVYNVKGQEVAKLVNGQVKAGFHNVSFNGASLNSGVYYYRLKADNKIVTKKMILVK